MEVREASVAYDVLAAAEADAVPVGYQRTEVGVIPEDWDLNPLGSLIVSTDYGSSAKSHARGAIPVLRMGNLQDGKIDWGDLVYTSDEREIEKYKLSLGDVLFNRTNTVELVGKTSIFDGKRPAVFAGYLIRIKCKPSVLEPRFLNFVLNAELSRKFSAKVLSVAVSQANINAQKLRTYLIPTPCFREQEAIAEALSDTDALIESLEQLIAKKRQVKQGAMQALLTGKQRLPGFHDEWKNRALGELGSTYGGLIGKTKSDFGDGSARYITFMNVMSNVIIDCSAFERVKISASESQNRVMKGDLLFNGSSETPEEVAMSSVVMENIPNLFLNSFCFGFRLRDGASADGLFLAYYLRSSEGRELMKSLAQGSTRYNLSKGAFLKAPLRLPTLSEQIAIATILSDMDTELTELETRLAKTRQLKQGMMQELLTGRIRLVQPALNVVPLPEKKETRAAAARPHNQQINEAVVIAALVKQFGSEDWPLARVRRTKLTYLLHRRAEGRADGFLKKAAGPYDPRTRYKGPEGIALKKGYVQALHNGTYEGFVASEHISEAETYFEKWYGADVMDWLERFRLRKTDELELLTTVDMAMEDLRREGKPISVEGVRQLIHGHPEWKPKLERAIFSDDGIAAAIAECQALFAS